MNHKEFNQILWSVVGVTVLCVVVVFLVAMVRLLMWGGGEERARIPAVREAGESNEGPRDSVELLRFDPATDRAPHRVASPEVLAAADALLK